MPLLFEGGKLKRSQLCGRYGCREENYIYKENALTHIEVKQYDIEGNSGNDLIHIFQYQDDGALESITKSFPNGYSEIIYKNEKRLLTSGLTTPERSVSHQTLILKGNTMIPDKLKDDFNSLRNMFDELKREIDKNVVREENYKGEFYEISPYSYQRNRFKQGKIVGNVTSLKTTNNLFTYYFDVKNQIIEI